MPILEIKNAGDAIERLSEFYGKLKYLKQYAEMLDLLNDPDRFKFGLREVSKFIWIAYNSDEVQSAPNRFTRAIIKVARERFGFSCQENVVLTAQANPIAFGKRISDCVLWKDSFALGHGEFAHSYQWLTAGLVLKWETNTADYYKATAGQMSNVALFVKDAGGINLRRAPLWEWLVDCTKYSNQFDGQASKLAQIWPQEQLTKWANDEPTSKWFIDSFFHHLDSRIKSGMAKEALAEKSYEDYWKPKRGRNVKNALVKEVLGKSDLKGFAVELAALYPYRNALTETSYRNANNVTALAREPGEEWFISVYENHRYSKLLEAQGKKFRQLTAELLRDLHTKDWESDPGGYFDLWARLFDVSIRVGMLEQTGPDSEKAFHVRVGDVAVQIARDYKLPTGNVKSIKPISALVKERKEHYQGRTQKGWNTAQDDPTIFLKKIVEETVKKNQIPRVFHEVKGWVNENALTGLVV
jgi:hypothetical protein